MATHRAGTRPSYHGADSVTVCPRGGRSHLQSAIVSKKNPEDRLTRRIETSWAPDEGVDPISLQGLFNLPPAQGLGMATVHHTSAERTIAELERLLGIELREDGARGAAAG